MVPNLMIGFGIDKTQAEYVAEIKLRHLNRGIHPRARRKSKSWAEIARLKEILDSPAKDPPHHHRRAVGRCQKYGEARRSEILYEAESEEEDEEEDSMPDYPVTVFFTSEGYFKKITPQSLRACPATRNSRTEIRSFCSRKRKTTQNCYSLPTAVRCTNAVQAILPMEASLMGDYIPASGNGRRRNAGLHGCDGGLQRPHVLPV